MRENRVDATDVVRDETRNDSTETRSGVENREVVAVGWYVVV